MNGSTVTPLQALRGLVDIARLIDADECPELYNQLQGVLAVAGAVLHEADQPVNTVEQSATSCAVCNGTGEKNGDGMLDCTACDAAETRTKLNNYTRSLGVMMPSTDRAWVIYQYAQRQAPQPASVSAAPSGPNVALVEALRETLRQAEGWYDECRGADASNLEWHKTAVAALSAAGVSP